MKLFPVITGLLFFVTACSESVGKPNFQFRPATQAGVVAKMGDITITEAELMDGAEAEIY